MVNLIALIVAAFGAVSGAYVGIWLMVIQPIMQVCAAFDSGSLTALAVGITVLKCIFAVPVGIGIFAVFCWGAGIVQIFGGKKKV
jgi:hypothetical protein